MWRGACHLGAWLCETKVFVPFGGLSYAKRACWCRLVRNYAKWGGLCRLRARLRETKVFAPFRGWLCETGMLASFGCAIARNGDVCVIWGLGYAKQRCLCRFGAWICKTGSWHRLGTQLCEMGGLCCLRAWLRETKVFVAFWSLVM